MRVLLLHNRYREQGGEERALAQTAALLTGRGHDVHVFERASADVTPLRAARALARGGDPATFGELCDALASLRPDVVHAHNIHPLLGWRALGAARAAGARTVLTLHNYRLFCATGVAYRDGSPCHACKVSGARPVARPGAGTQAGTHARLGRGNPAWGRISSTKSPLPAVPAPSLLPGVVHRCRGTLPEAVAYAAGLTATARHLPSVVDRLIALSDSQARLLRSRGVVSPEMTVVPNFVPAAGVVDRSAAGSGEYALLAGRLVPEKGFDTAIRAAKAAEVPLLVAGAGPDEARLRAIAAGADVRFTGWIDAGELAALRARAGLVLVPSRWEEVCPFAVLEAFAAGVAVLASDRGGLPELLAPGSGPPPDARRAPRAEPPPGALLPATDDAAWARELRTWWADPARRRSSGEAALGLAVTRYGEERAYRELISVYSCEP